MEFNDTERIILARYIAEANLAYTNEISRTVNIRDTFYTKYGKRMIDILISGIALIVTLPINIVIGIVTYFDVGRPIFFYQKRIGKDGKIFKMVKFRNMTNETDDKGNLLLPKYRVTRWGRFVRKTSLDELLNFWSIFKGDMSIIGPRPLVCNYVSRYSERHMMRHVVRPGLECPNISMVEQGANKWNEQFENDIWYVENVSLLVDLKMVLGLIGLVFDRKKIQKRSSANGGAFMGYNEEGIAISHKDIPQRYIEQMYMEYGNIITKSSLENF